MHGSNLGFWVSGSTYSLLCGFKETKEIKRMNARVVRESVWVCVCGGIMCTREVHRVCGVWRGDNGSVATAGYGKRVRLRRAKDFMFALFLSRNVLKHVLVFDRSFEVLLFYQLFDASLDGYHGGIKPNIGLFDDFFHQQRVTRRFSSLHHTHCNCLQEELSIFIQRFAQLSVLLWCLSLHGPSQFNFLLLASA